MSLYKTYETDESIEKDGQAFQMGEDSQGRPIDFICRRAGGANGRFQKSFEEKSRPVRHILNSKTPGAVSAKTQERVMREVFVDSVLVGWRNVEGRDGQPMEFNRENALKLFTDLPDLFRELLSMTQEGAAFRRIQREEEAGN